MSSKLPISVCMLCLNEADRLPKTLKQVDAFAEWLIYDTGSTDNSIELGKKAGATVLERPWEGFSITRIKHFEEASQPWILWIDADEVVTPELVEELRQLFANGIDLEHNGYWLNRMIQFEGKWIRHGDWFPDWNVRLFRQGEWSMEEREVHESLEIRGSIDRVHSPLEHHSFRSWEDKEARSLKYAKLWAEMQLKKGKSSSTPAAFFRGIWKFLRGFIVKKGFLDGAIGFQIAVSNAKETYLKYSLLSSLKKG